LTSSSPQAPPPLPPPPPPQSPAPSFWAFAKGLQKQPNFLVFAGMTSLQTFDCALGKQFFTIFLALLVGDALPPGGHAVLVAASFLLPWLAAAALSRRLEVDEASSPPASEQSGGGGSGSATLSGTLEGLWAARVGLLALTSAALILLAATGGKGAGLVPGAAEGAAEGAGVWARRALGLVVLGNRVMSECVCRLVPLVEGDLIDEHAYLNSGDSTRNRREGGHEVSGGMGGGNRSGSMGATLVGTANFLSKPSASLGPIAGFAVLSRAVPSMVQRGGAAPGTLGAASSATASADFAASVVSAAWIERHSVLVLVLGLPLAVVGCQLLLWRRFTLKGRYLAAVKAFLAASKEACAV
jgi:hypothetical protein